MGLNYIRDIMRADLDSYTLSMSGPRKFTFISRLIRPIDDRSSREVWIEDRLTGRPRAFLAGPWDVVEYRDMLYAWTGSRWEEFIPGPCTNYDGPIPNNRIYASSSMAGGDKLAKTIRENTDILLKHFGIGYDYPSAIEQHENMVVARYDLRYLGEVFTDVKSRPKDRRVFHRVHGIWTKEHYARIGDVVSYNDVEYVYSGEENGWIAINDYRKEAATMLTHYDRVKPNWLSIKKVVFNDPATIVFWGDGTKTVVKCSDNEAFDPEKGLVMAIAKKAFGNRGNYYNQIKKWLPDDGPVVHVDGEAIRAAAETLADAVMTAIEDET